MGWMFTLLGLWLHAVLLRLRKSLSVRSSGPLHAALSGCLCALAGYWSNCGSFPALGATRGQPMLQLGMPVLFEPQLFRMRRLHEVSEKLTSLRHRHRVSPVERLVPVCE
ncbi:MAG: hypothetical protein CMJ47_09045 [Planctomyces sp.]|nr:hypothetical protein [Planctomyces sp.]